MNCVVCLVLLVCYVLGIFKLYLLSEFNCFCMGLVLFGLQALVILLEPSEISELTFGLLQWKITEYNSEVLRNWMLLYMVNYISIYHN